MSARKIKQSWWVDFRSNGVRYRKRSPESSRAGALLYETMLRQRLVRGEPIDDTVQAPTFAEFVPQWFETYVIPNNKLSEREAKDKNLRIHLLPWFGATRLDAITASDLERYKAAKLASGLTPKTINNHLATFMKCLRSAQEWGRLTAVPRTKFLRVPPQPYDFLTAAESDGLLAASKSDVRAHAMILTGLRTGMRLGELRGLEWRNVDLGRRVIFVCQAIVSGQRTSPKNHRTRYVPIAPSLVQTLEALGPCRGYVFGESGTAMGCQTAYTVLRQACRRAGLRRIGWHVLRHTFASQLAAAGVPIRVVQELMGHAAIQMTMRYAHLAPSTLIDAVGVLEAAARTPWATGGQPTVGPSLQAAPTHSAFLADEKQKRIADDALLPGSPKGNRTPGTKHGIDAELRGNPQTTA